MKYSLLVSAVILPTALFSLAGCGGDGTSPATPMPPSPNAPTRTTLAPPSGSTVSTVSQTSAATPSMVAPIAPVDAKYTIICTRFTGPGHVQQAKLAKDNLVRATGRKEFYLLHEDEQSTLYFGYYSQIDRELNPAEAERAEKDMQFLRSLTDASGQKIFPGCLKEALPVADPNGPPEFDLTKIDADKAPDDPTRRYWSIAIAAYTVDAEGSGEDFGKNRKQLALESVLAARKMGIEAYYYNGENVSTVCIGAWPRAAIREQESNEAKSNADTGQDLVVSAAPLPANLTQQLENSGRNIKVFQPKIVVDDPSLRETWRKFRFYSVNGIEQINRTTDPHTGKVTDERQESFLVQIPEVQPSIVRNEQATDQDAAPTDANPMNPNISGGQLRSLGR